MKYFSLYIAQSYKLILYIIIFIIYKYFKSLGYVYQTMSPPIHLETWEQGGKRDVFYEILHKGPNQMTVPQAKRIAEGEGKVYLWVIVRQDLSRHGEPMLWRVYWTPVHWTTWSLSGMCRRAAEEWGSDRYSTALCIERVESMHERIRFILPKWNRALGSRLCT
jgi:hypothetical protein